MKTRAIITIGIFIIVTIPLATYSALNWYEVNYNTITTTTQDINSLPKPGDKYYIEPKRKAVLEAAELEIRDKISQLHHTSPLTAYGVNLDYETKKIIVIVETEQFNSEIRGIISQYPDDIQIIFYNSKIELQDEFKKFSSSENKPKEADSYGLDEMLCLGGRAMILNEKCEKIGKYDIHTGIPIVENEKQCDLLNGVWYDKENKCDSKYTPVEYRFQFGYSFLEYEKPEICTDEMMMHLATYSNMFVDEEDPYFLEWIGMGDNIDADDFDACEDDLLKLR